MKDTRQSHPARVETAFLDANVIRGQQTTDVLLSLASRRVFEPRWTQKVIDEMRRNRPPGLTEAAIDRRITTMNKAFPRAMTAAPPQALEDEMQADPKDKHVLAGAVHSESDVLVTDNLKDFAPPTSGPNAMRVENLNQFLIRKLEEDPERLQEGLHAMLDRNRREPRSMSALIDTMAEGQELRGFARQLNSVVPPDQRGSSPVLVGTQRGSAQYAAFEGVVEPGKPDAPSTAPEARKSGGSKGVEKAKGTEQDK
ncbi:PIN domain-containing protein [Kribbella shirazensis]|uniref:Putative nucleic acid-binding protein n=1 Tax=Kribbella shirazensis TaxID=1105143 RepID=A0A7X5VH15_9ACTN|nr:PIN domain-containing protein [Kribbella shirazensis]NIK60929.1 putative nucleic acid-binding protein [Kribbella shirazensis]